MAGSLAAAPTPAHGDQGHLLSSRVPRVRSDRFAILRGGLGHPFSVDAPRTIWVAGHLKIFSATTVLGCTRPWDRTIWVATVGIHLTCVLIKNWAVGGKVFCSRRWFHRDRVSGMRYSPGAQHNAVYWRGALYVHSQTDYVMRCTLTR